MCRSKFLHKMQGFCQRSSVTNIKLSLLFQFLCSMQSGTRQYSMAAMFVFSQHRILVGFLHFVYSRQCGRKSKNSELRWYCFIESHPRLFLAVFLLTSVPIMCVETFEFMDILN